MTRTRRLDFGSGPDPDPAYQWDTKRKLFSLVEVCVLRSAVPVYIEIHDPFKMKSKRLP